MDLDHARRRTIGRMACRIALGAALALGGALAANAEEGREDIPVRGSGCVLVAEPAVIGRCPPHVIPEREEPWLPVVELPDPDAMACERLAVVVDNIEVTRCPAMPGGLAIQLDSPAAYGAGIDVAIAPDYDGPSDILPFQLCFGPEPWPESITLRGPTQEDIVTSARLRAFCCETC